MTFKDISNQDISNLQNCEDELIHIPGSIQPYGFLLAVKEGDLTIDFCSANSFELSGLDYRQLLGKDIKLILGEHQTNELAKFLLLSDEYFIEPLRLTLLNNHFNCTVHKKNGLVLLEFEPWQIDNLRITDVYKQTRQVTTYIQEQGTLQELCQYVADETRSITGYDRVMIYKFDEDYNGEVYAESKIEANEPWLNLHYPHTDIPAQARALFMQNLLRIIPDVSYQPSPIYTIDDSVNKTLDLSLSILRSSSPIHIQYLKNMGVAASLTISLVHRERLWGLIACHHNSPKYIHKDLRIAAQLQGHLLTSQISSREVAEEYKVARKVSIALDCLLAQVFTSEGITIDNLVNLPELLALTNAKSVVVILHDKIYTSGKTPPSSDLKMLANWLHTYSPPTGIAISNLVAVYPDAQKWSDLVSGVLYHSLGSGADDCIIWCRPEIVQEVHWAGKPKDAVSKVDGSLSPRNSFELWKEIKRHESARWQNPELIAATSFSNAFQKHVHMQFLAKEELKQRKLNSKLKEANAELENLYWIGSHDLKEPLRKIQVFASRIMNEEHAGDLYMISNMVRRMNDSARRMQLLVSDIVAYSRLNYVEDRLEDIHFDDVVKAVIAELLPEIEEQKAVIEYNTPVQLKGVFFYLKQLLVNLVRNSLKFSKPATQPYISIQYEGTASYDFDITSSQMFHKISVNDHGIGFDNRHSEAIFKVFTRLHDQNEYSGSGVGLALCSKIMKNHGGYITARGEPGVGTNISLFFPK